MNNDREIGDSQFQRVADLPRRGDCRRVIDSELESSNECSFVRVPSRRQNNRRSRFTIGSGHKRCRRSKINGEWSTNGKRSLPDEDTNFRTCYDLVESADDANADDECSDFDPEQELAANLPCLRLGDDDEVTGVSRQIHPNDSFCDIHNDSISVEPVFEKLALSNGAAEIAPNVTPPPPEALLAAGGKRSSTSMNHIVALSSPSSTTVNSMLGSPFSSRPKRRCASDWSPSGVVNAKTSAVNFETIQPQEFGKMDTSPSPK